MRPWILAETNYAHVKDNPYEVAVLPLGATEPHNLHLPYGTDILEGTIVGERICQAAHEKGARVVLLPTIPYGTETNMHAFPLAMNLDPSTLNQVVTDLVESLVGSNIRKIVLLNSHGGNEMKPLLRELCNKTEARLFLCNWYNTLADVYHEIFSEKEDHAGEMETSFGLAFFPELEALVGVPQDPEWHPEGDVWVHTLQVIDQARSRIDDLDYPQQMALMLGAVCHDLGKPATSEFIDGRIRSRNHEEAGVEPTRALLDRLNVHSMNGYDVRHQVIGMVAQHLKPGMWHKSTGIVGDGAFRRLARKVDLDLLARLAKSDCLGRGGTFDCSAMDWFLERARALGVEHAPPAPLLLGRHLLDLGLRPGPEIGRILKAVYEQQLDGRVTALEAAIAAAETIIGGAAPE